MNPGEWEERKKGQGRLYEALETFGRGWEF